jgi:hypothetical protein
MIGTLTNPRTGQPETWAERVARMDHERIQRDNPRGKPQVCSDICGVVR